MWNPFVKLIFLRSMLALSTVAFLVPAACDRAPEVDPPILATQPIQHEMPGPTRDEILSGPRKTLELLTLPLSLQTPESWEARELPGSALVMVQGRGPDGDIQITVSPRAATSAEKITLLEAGAQKEMAQNSDIKRVSLRKVRAMQMLEKQTLITSADTPTVPDGEGTPTTSTSMTFKWSIQVFVPHDDMFETYEVSFIGLTPAEYESSKEFLNAVLESITYIGSR